MYDVIYEGGYITIYKKKDGSTIRVYDNCNDFDCKIDTLFLNELLSAFERMIEDEEIFHGDCIHTTEYIDKFINSGLKYGYTGNWIRKDRILKIINAIKDNCTNHIYDKEKILNDLDNFKIDRLKILVDIIKRKGDTNETSRN